MYDELTINIIVRKDQFYGDNTYINIIIINEPLGYYRGQKNKLRLKQLFIKM